MQNKISRRQFLQVTGASAAALLLTGQQQRGGRSAGGGLCRIGPSDRYAGYPRL